MQALDIGDNSVDGSPLVSLSIQPGDNITVNVVGGSTLNYWTSDDGTGAGTIANGSSATFSQPPVYMQSQGRSSVQITGGGY